MNESFNSSSTYCSSIEIENNERIKRNIRSTLLKDITKRVQSHLEGKHLLANNEVKQHLEHIASYKANTYKSKNQVEKLKSILNMIYKRNRIFEENMVKLKSLVTVQKDPFTDFGISQDLQMICNSKDKLQPIHLPVSSDNEVSTFHSDMLTNQNFLNTHSEFDNLTKNKSSDLVLHSNYTASPIPNQTFISVHNENKENIYGHGSMFDINSETDTSQLSGIGLSQELNAIHLKLANEQNSQSYINKDKAKLNNVESISFCTDMLSGHNFIDSSKEHSQLPNNCLPNSEVWSIVNPDKILHLDSTLSLMEYRDVLTKQHIPKNNNEHFKKSEDCLDNNNQHFENNFNNSEDIFSTEKSIEQIKTNQILIPHGEEQCVVYKKDDRPKVVKIVANLHKNSTKCFFKSKTSQKMSTTNKKLEKLISIENMSVDDSLSQASSTTNCSNQMIISNSFCDTDSNNYMVEHQRRHPLKSAVFKKPSSGNDSFISDSDVITSTQYFDESMQNIVKRQTPHKGNFFEKISNTSVVSNKSMLEDSCDDLCKLTTKFLKIVDDQDVEDEGEKCVNILKNIVNPGIEKDVQEIGELGTNSSTWEESSEDIENMGQIHQEISSLLIDVLESINSQEHSTKDFDTFEVEAAKYLDPVDVTELDLKTLLQSNNVIIQDISKSFKKHLLTDNFFQSNNPPVTDDCFDWRNIN